jgi:hypothetical protein
MLWDLTPEQKRLEEFMSDISEKCYTAGWIHNLEYVLWYAMHNGPFKFAQDWITQEEIDELKRLSQECNCWIYMDDDTEETAIEFSLWQQKYDEFAAKYPDATGW